MPDDGAATTRRATAAGPDVLWGTTVLLVLGLILSPWTSPTYETFTTTAPYPMGFVKFALLATLGELLAVRLREGRYRLPAYLAARALVWGVVGVLVVFSFTLYTGGLAALQAKGLYPSWGPLWDALSASAVMNLTFGPAFMAAHRVSDAWLDNRACGVHGVGAAVRRIDWESFMTFVVGRTVPLFWIPAHTVTFLLPAEYRVFVAALLSIVLGVLLTLASRRRTAAPDSAPEAVPGHEFDI